MAEILFTPEKIAQIYSAGMDSVNLINSEKPVGMGMTDERWDEIVKLNKECLRLLLEKDFWTNEDLTPFEIASR